MERGSPGELVLTLETPKPLGENTAEQWERDSGRRRRRRAGKDSVLGEKAKGKGRKNPWQASRGKRERSERAQGVPGKKKGAAGNWKVIELGGAKIKGKETLKKKVGKGLGGDRINPRHKSGRSAGIA